MTASPVDQAVHADQGLHVQTTQQASAGYRVPSSIYALIVANLVPVCGVLFFGWSIFELMMVFWLENVVIGFYNVLRMITVSAEATRIPMLPGVPGGSKFFVIPFFVVHYGIFTLVHGVFVFVLFGGMLQGPLAGRVPQEPLHVAALGWSFLALMLSHGISFWLNYIRDGEYRRTSLMRLMARPYARIVVLHVTILVGAFGAVALGSGWVALLVLTLLKIAIDIRGHLSERRALAATGDRDHYSGLAA